MHLNFQTLKNSFEETLLKYQFPKNQAEEIARVFTETSFDGVFSHGINRFPRFIGDVKKGTVRAGIIPELKQAGNAFEQWDGLQGAGISNALFCTDRCLDLASENGIGCVGLRNTNHWMRGGSYGWRAAEKGKLFIGWTNTMPNMPPWGGSSPRLGNNPLVLAIPHEEGHLVLDMAMSQYAYGKLEWHQRMGSELPEYGGYNQDGQLTKNPGEILNSGQILPTGLWKGSSLALMLDLAAALISGGNTTEMIGKLESETALSQLFIAVDMERYINAEQKDQLVKETLAYVKDTGGQIRYPGQRSSEDRIRNLEKGIEVPEELWKQILAL